MRLREPNWPPRVLQIANAYHNQLELPVLFYIVMLLAMSTRTLDVVIYVLAWMFVLSRIAHAYIHVTSNRLDRRTGGVWHRRHRAASDVGDRRRPHLAVQPGLMTPAARVSAAIEVLADIEARKRPRPRP